MNHVFAMQELDTSGDLEHDIPNLSTLHGRRLVFDEIGCSRRFVQRAVDVIGQIHVAKLHIEEDVLRDIPNLQNGDNMRIPTTFIQPQDRSNFVFNDRRIDPGDMDQFSREKLILLGARNACKGGTVPVGM
jgi:hypothetical protein